MGKDYWEDEEIEQLLRNFPKIEDHRPKEEVYRRLKKSTKKRRSPIRWMPAAVAALAFFTIAVLLASLIGENNNASYEMSESTESGGESSMMAPSEEAEVAKDETGMTSDSAQIEESQSMRVAPDNRTAVYEADLAGNILFTVGLTENAYVVPVSFLIPQQQVVADLGTAEPDLAALYNHYAASIDETALGFDEYHPYAGELSFEDGRIEHRLPAGHPYGLGSAAVTVYMNSLRTTFSEAEEIAVLNEDGTTAEIDPIGPVSPIEGGNGRTAYYLFTVSAGGSYLVPSFDMTYDSLPAALEALKTSPNDLLASPVPQGVDYAVSETAGSVLISFSEPLDLDSLQPAEAMRMIESMLLTAESFGATVRFENLLQTEWQGIALSGELEGPVAPNKMEWSAE